MSCDRVEITCTTSNVICDLDHTQGSPSAHLIRKSVHPAQTCEIMADMDVDVDTPAVAAPKKDDSKRRFEVKKVCKNLPDLCDC